MAHNIYSNWLRYLKQKRFISILINGGNFIFCLGGMVLNPSYFGTTGHQNTMIHEMGHIFGLYHVFKGVSERDSCDDPCQVGQVKAADYKNDEHAVPPIADPLKSFFFSM